jgi:hypothetical protein
MAQIWSDLKRDPAGGEYRNIYELQTLRYWQPSSLEGNAQITVDMQLKPAKRVFGRRARITSPDVSGMLLLLPWQQRNPCRRENKGISRHDQRNRDSRDTKGYVCRSGEGHQHLRITDKGNPEGGRGNRKRAKTVFNDLLESTDDAELDESQIDSLLDEILQDDNSESEQKVQDIDE